MWQRMYKTDQPSEMQQARQQFDQLKQRLSQRENAVIAHEQAHQQAAGSLAGAATYGRKSVSMTMPDGSEERFEYIDEGEVPIELPGMPSEPASTPQGRQEIEQALVNYETVEQAAIAPGSLAGGLSAADQSIAAIATSRQATLSQLLSQTDKILSNPLPENTWFGGMNQTA